MATTTQVFRTRLLAVFCNISVHYLDLQKIRYQAKSTDQHLIIWKHNIFSVAYLQKRFPARLIWRAIMCWEAPGEGKYGG